MNNKTPYENLDPNVILDAVEQAGFLCNGSLFALNSYENRVYQIGIEDASPVIVKFYRPERWSNEAILEEHQFAAELAEHEIPVIAPLQSKTHETLHFYQGFRFALFARQGGRGLELDNLEQLEWMGRFLGRLHAVGACHRFKHRPQLTLQSHGVEPYQFLKEHFIPDYLKINYCHTVEKLLEVMHHHFQHIGEIHYIRLHGDMHAGNVLWNDAGPHIVDLDDCLMGPIIQDLWMLLSGNPLQMKKELDCILGAYCEFHDFNFRELHLIEVMRTLRMLHYSAWLAKRWDDPAFPLSFPWFNTPRYWQDQLQNLNEQLALLEEINH